MYEAIGQFPTYPFCLKCWKGLYQNNWSTISTSTSCSQTDSRPTVHSILLKRSLQIFSLTSFWLYTPQTSLCFHFWICLPHLTQSTMIFCSSVSIYLLACHPLCWNG